MENSREQYQRSRCSIESGKMHFRPHEHAFTLIELLVVIAVIALLTGLLVPVLGRVREQGRRAACMSNIRQFIIGIQVCANDDRERNTHRLSIKIEPRGGTGGLV